MSSFDDAIESLDLGLFASIESQTSDHDKRSLLACQLGVRTEAPEYAYLEIGSHLGGSLQPYLQDPRCTRVYSIDNRIASQPDARGVAFAYRENSRARMLGAITSVPGADSTKVVCFDTDAAAVNPALVRPQPLLCLIDGEHTDSAVIRDFAFCRQAVVPDGAVVFHDASILYLALTRIVEDLSRAGVSFRAYHLPDTVFVIEWGACTLHRTPAIQDMLLNNHVGYLSSLRGNDHFRRFANRPVFRALRAFRRLAGGRA